MSPCISCGTVFTYNPNTVPSSSAITGSREPICEPCVHKLNEIRKEKGLDKIEIIPGAYEPADEIDDV